MNIPHNETWDQHLWKLQSYSCIIIFLFSKCLWENAKNILLGLFYRQKRRGPHSANRLSSKVQSVITHSLRELLFCLHLEAVSQDRTCSVSETKLLSCLILWSCLICQFSLGPHLLGCSHQCCSVCLQLNYENIILNVNNNDQKQLNKKWLSFILLPRIVSTYNTLWG